MCFNVDGKLASELIIGAVGQENWEVCDQGQGGPRRRCSGEGHLGYAGCSPRLWPRLARPAGSERSRSARARAPATSASSVDKEGKPAGDATNVVTDYAYLKGEARSPKAAFATQIALGFKEAFAKAKSDVKDASGATAEVKFDHAPAYPPFNLDKKSTVVDYAGKAVASLGLKPTYVFSNGGLDANWLDKHGIPTVTIGAGQYEIHTVNEYVDLPEYAQGLPAWRSPGHRKRTRHVQ